METINLSSSRTAENAFLNLEAPTVHEGFGGFIVKANGTLAIPNHYRRLQPQLQAYVHERGLRRWGSSPSITDWHALYDDLATAQAKTEEVGRSPLDIFGKLVIKVGEKADRLDPWLNLIPNEFGLCILKTAFAVLLDMSKTRAERKRTIIDAFLEVRDILGTATAKMTHFQSDPDVYRQAGLLYEAVIDTIQALLSTTEPAKHSRWLFKPKSHQAAMDPQEVLRGLKQSAKVLSLAVEKCRDANIKSSAQNSEKTLRIVQSIGWQGAEIKNIATNLNTAQEAQSSMIQHLRTDVSELRVDINQNLFSMWRERESAYQGWIEALLEELKSSKSRDDRPLPGPEKSRQVITPKRLLSILAFPATKAPARESMNLDIMTRLMEDVGTVLSRIGSLNAVDQGRVHSLLYHDRFMDWVNTNHPDLVLIEGNFQHWAAESITPLSLLCAQLGLTLGKQDGDALIFSFYCGLHTDPSSDPSPGPVGLLRALIVHLVLNLLETNRLDMEFLNSREFVRKLERHELGALCDLLHNVLQQFDSVTRIYCIIDNISQFDISFDGFSLMMQTVAAELQQIIVDEHLRPILKIIVTVPYLCSGEMQSTVSDRFRVVIGLNMSEGRPLTESSIESALFTEQQTRGSHSVIEHSGYHTSNSEEDYDDL